MEKRTGSNFKSFYRDFSKAGDDDKGTAIRDCHFALSNNNNNKSSTVIHSIVSGFLLTKHLSERKCREVGHGFVEMIQSCERDLSCENVKPRFVMIFKARHKDSTWEAGEII